MARVSVDDVPAFFFSVQRMLRRELENTYPSTAHVGGNVSSGGPRMNRAQRRKAGLHRGARRA